MKRLAICLSILMLLSLILAGCTPGGDGKQEQSPTVPTLDQPETHNENGQSDHSGGNSTADSAESDGTSENRQETEKPQSPAADSPEDLEPENGEDRVGSDTDEDLTPVGVDGNDPDATVDTSEDLIPSEPEEPTEAPDSTESPVIYESGGLTVIDEYVVEVTEAAVGGN